MYWYLRWPLSWIELQYRRAYWDTVETNEFFYQIIEQSLLHHPPAARTLVWRA